MTPNRALQQSLDHPLQDDRRFISSLRIQWAHPTCAGFLRKLERQKSQDIGHRRCLVADYNGKSRRILLPNAFKASDNTYQGIARSILPAQIRDTEALFIKAAI